MRLAYYIKDILLSDLRAQDLLAKLSVQGAELKRVRSVSEVPQGCRALLSMGGDGSFLCAAQIAVQAGLPILGVNFGRLGFLSGVSPEELPQALANDAFISENRDILQVTFNAEATPRCGDKLDLAASSQFNPNEVVTLASADLSTDSSSEAPDQGSLAGSVGEAIWPYAFNEMCVSRSAASMLGIDVSIDGTSLPTYWADGLLVATSAGSTAYSLSVGGPICTPDTQVFIVSPISSHNLNVRPLVVPRSSSIAISFRSRAEKLVFSADNRNVSIPSSTHLTIQAAPFALERLCTSSEDFITALRTRLLWGQDLRNNR